MIRLAIVSRDANYLINLLNILRMQQDMEVIDAIVIKKIKSDEDRAFIIGEQLIKLNPDIVLLDLLIVRELVSMYPRMLQKYAEKSGIIKPVIICKRFQPNNVMSMIKLGARGFILQQDTQTDVVKCLKAVTRDDFELNEPLKSQVFNEFVRDCRSNAVRMTASTEKPVNQIPLLSQREAVILKLISENMTNNEIADQLLISAKTVKKHIYHIFKKTGVRNRIKAAHFYASYRPSTQPGPQLPASEIAM